MITLEPIATEMCFNVTTIKTLILYQDAQNAAILFFVLGLILGIVMMFFRSMMEE
jgi:hypothetical protein